MDKVSAFLLILISAYIAYNIYKLLNKKHSAESFELEGKTLVFVYADWCGHCTRFKPDWEKITILCDKANIKHKALNVDDESSADFIDKYEVTSFPTLIVLKDDQHKKFDGDRSINTILEFAENF